MEPFSPPARDAPLRRRAKTADAAGSAAEPAIVSPEQTRHRRSIATSTQNAGDGDDDDDCDHHHLSSCSSSSLGGGLGSSTSGSADLRRGQYQHAAERYSSTHHAPQPLPQLHRRHTYAGGPIAATAATAQQRRSVAIEIPAAMKEVVFRHSRSRLLDNAGDGQNGNDNDNDAASTVSSLEVDLGHGRSSSSHVAEGQEDPRRQFWTERRSSTNALCGGEGINIGIGGTGTATDGDAADQHGGGDDDEPSYMSYSLSTSSPCKSARADRCSSKGSINNNKRAAAAKKKHHHRRDSSLLGGLGLLEITPAAPASAANSAAGAGAAVSGADGRRSASLLHQSDSLLSRRAASQAPQACHHRHPPKRRSLSHHRRHNSESILPNTSIGTDTTAETEGTGSIGNCLSPPPPPPRHQFGPSLSSLLQHFSAGNNGTGSDKPGHSGRAGETAKTMHRRCSSAGCGVAIA